MRLYSLCLVLASHGISIFALRSHIRPVVRSSSLALRSGDRVIDSIRSNLEVPPESILSAVEKAPNYRLTVADCAASSGMDLFSARQGLTLLASLTGGDLEVTQEGDIVYSFANDFRSRLYGRSVGQKLKEFYRIIAPILFYLVRISFGVFLLASLAIISSTFFVVISGGSSSNDDREQNRSHPQYQRNVGFYFDPSILDFFYYRPYYTTSYRDPTQMSFLESFFSYIFGDGDPNAEFESEQVKILGITILAFSN